MWQNDKPEINALRRGFYGSLTSIQLLHNTQSRSIGNETEVGSCMFHAWEINSSQYISHYWTLIILNNFVHTPQHYACIALLHFLASTVVCKAQLCCSVRLLMLQYVVRYGVVSARKELRNNSMKIPLEQLTPLYYFSLWRPLYNSCAKRHVAFLLLVIFPISRLPWKYKCEQSS